MPTWIFVAEEIGMLISLHLPKTAGSSFLRALEAIFGKDLLQDYSDMSNIQQYLSGNISAHEVCDCAKVQPDWIHRQCIHGHFLPAKYLAARDKCSMTFVTWLRDPVERLMSHYHYFKRSYDPKTAGPLFRKVVEEDWTLKRFCFSEEYRNLYAKYLWNFPCESFDFIGLTEFYEDDLRYLSERFLNVKLDACKLNCAIDGETGRYEVDAGFRREIEEFHSEDMALYKRVLWVREQRA